ncbi:putative transcription factor MADS-type1 family [Lupinus albus]|uniref:Putative transcription factor MADS-type1 family n=1 Tax=Lupinus albus TaxID=3870 RepID=A0A6A4NQN4_LUPAL|nr:putative transcription factor MADS-type1 family [Lupinus albus]
MKPTYIVNESKRKVTYKLRKIGMKNKLHEISTLCGIQACVIIYDPNETEPEVWPSHSEVQRVISRFNAMSNIDQGENMSTQKSFLQKNFEKARDQLKKARDENKKHEMELFMFQCLGIGNIINNDDTIDMNYFLVVINQNLRYIYGKKSRDQPQHGIGVVVNGTDTSNGERKTVGGHNQEIVQTNMGVMQRLGLSSDLANGEVM